MEKQNVPVEITPEGLFVKREARERVQWHTDHLSPLMSSDNIQTCVKRGSSYSRPSYKNDSLRNWCLLVWAQTSLTRMLGHWEWMEVKIQKKPNRAFRTFRCWEGWSWLAKWSLVPHRKASSSFEPWMLVSNFSFPCLNLSRWYLLGMKPRDSSCMHSLCECGASPSRDQWNGAWQIPAKNLAPKAGMRM